MRWFVFFCAPALFSAFAQGSGKLELCYFDLSGQPDSGSLMRNLKHVENETNISIHAEAPEKNADINKAFEKWVRSRAATNKNCSGLIFSGYHTGGHFHQERTEAKDNRNKLSLTLIERLACDEDLKNWFGGVKQLWLFGSHTVNNKYLQKARTEPENLKPTAVGTKTGDKLATPVTTPTDDGGDTYANLNKMGLSFAHALDEGAPLSSRYMRAFPGANIYGWSGEAPTSHQITKDWKDTHPIYAHIKLIGEARRAEEASTNGTDRDKETVVQGIEFLAGGDYCGDKWSKITQDGAGVEGVEKKDYGKAAELGCDLINAQKAMDTVQQVCKKKYNTNPNIKNKAQRKCEKETLKKAQRKIITTLKKINAEEEKIKKARETLATDSDDSAAQTVIKTYLGEAGLKDKTLTLSHLLFNEMDSAYLTARRKGNKLLSDKERKPFLNGFKETLTKTSPVIQALKDKVKSPVLSTVRKVDYIEFYKSLHGTEDNFVKESVQTIIDEKLKCAYWKPKSDGACPEQKVAEIQTTTTATDETRDVLVENNSLLGAGRGVDKITPKHHYTLTAVVSDQLKQYGLLNETQAKQLQSTLEKTPESEQTPYTKQIATCITETDFRKCKNAS